MTLNLDTTKVPTLAGANTFTASNAFTGNVSAGSLAVASTAQVANLVASQNINFGGSVLYQGSLLLQFPASNIALGRGASEQHHRGLQHSWQQLTSTPLGTTTPSAVFKRCKPTLPQGNNTAIGYPGDDGGRAAGRACVATRCSPAGLLCDRRRLPERCSPKRNFHSATQPLACRRCSPTPPGTATRPLAKLRCYPIPPGVRTRPLASLR